MCGGEGVEGWCVCVFGIKMFREVKREALCVCVWGGHSVCVCVGGGGVLEGGGHCVCVCVCRKWLRLDNWHCMQK